MGVVVAITNENNSSIFDGIMYSPKRRKDNTVIWIATN